MSSDDFTRAVTVKRNTKKKSGYTISKSDDGYIVEAVPDKARVQIGDKVMGINGVHADDFADEEDANELLESIRLVVVPADEIQDYEAAKAAEESGAAPAGNALAAPGGKQIIHCPHCGHDNEDLTPDEEGDLVCENCGTVIEDEGGDDDGVLKCSECGHENHNLEPDEDGDLVCEQCGTVLPEKGTTGSSRKKDEEYECPDCGHITVNPEPDDEGDRICEECGCILPEKLRCVCKKCGHENVDPEPNDAGKYVCEECGDPLDVGEAEKTRAQKLKEMNDKYAEEAAQGQEFDEDGKPLTNPEGKKLTPADMFSPGDVITVTVGKSNPKQDAGLKVEQGQNGKYYVRKVPSSGLFARTPVIAGDKILELNGKDSKDFKDVNEMKKMIRDEQRLTIVVLRRDPDASESSADSDIDFDNLAPITPNGVMREEIQEKDDDTAGYDGHDCGCVWCPDCHP